MPAMQECRDKKGDYLMKKADIGMIGLAVMGENLVLNMESKGFRVSVYNRTVEKVDKFISGRGAGKNFYGAHSLEDLVASLKAPRRVFLMVKAGQPVDDFIEKLIPLLDKGEKVFLVVIDNFRYDQWRVLATEIGDMFDIDEDIYCSILPTATQYARNSIFSGLMPDQIAKMFPDLWVDEDEEVWSVKESG